jgi:hypothetical protein
VTQLVAARQDPDRVQLLVHRSIQAAQDHAGWYLGAAYSWLPDSLLNSVTEAAVQDRLHRDNPSADEVILFASMQRPSLLSAHLPQLWATDPNASAYYRTWPWRAADDGEISRLLDVFQSSRSDQERRRAAESLLQTRRPDLARLVGKEWPGEMELVGFVGEPGGPREVITRETWHLAFPQLIIDKWQRRGALRQGNPTWVAGDDLRPQAHIGGVSLINCPQCTESTHRLIRLGAIPGGLGVTSRRELEFVWCSWCSTFSEVTFLRFDSLGLPASMTLQGYFDTGPRLPMEPFAEIDVSLSSVGERWRLQDWACSNNRENLHRIGGEPTWIQGPVYPPCPECRRAMVAIGQIAVEDLWDGEGIAYLLWCDECAIGGVVYQQT